MKSIKLKFPASSIKNLANNIIDSSFTKESYLKGNKGAATDFCKFINTTYDCNIVFRDKDGKELKTFWDQNDIFIYISCFTYTYKLRISRFESSCGLGLLQGLNSQMSNITHSPISFNDKIKTLAITKATLEVLCTVLHISTLIYSTVDISYYNSKVNEIDLTTLEDTYTDKHYIESCFTLVNSNLDRFINLNSGNLCSIYHINMVPVLLHLDPMSYIDEAGLNDKELDILSSCYDEDTDEYLNDKIIKLRNAASNRSIKIKPKKVKTYDEVISSRSRSRAVPKTS